MTYVPKDPPSLIVRTPLYNLYTLREYLVTNLTAQFVRQGLAKILSDKFMIKLKIMC